MTYLPFISRPRDVHTDQHLPGATPSIVYLLMSDHPPAQAREPVPDTYSPDAKNATGIRDVAVRRSDKLLVLQSMFSLVFRTIAYIFLRVIPGSFGFYAIHFYLGYLAIWVLYDVRVASQKTRRMSSLSSLVFGHLSLIHI